MIEGLTTVARAFYAVAKDILEHRHRADTKRQQLALLTAQFCFVGLAETGRQLLELAGPRPLDKLMSLQGDGLRTFHALVQKHMSLQHERLQKLHGLFSDQEVVDIFDPPLRRDIERAIGDKEDGLYSIGAALLYYFVFVGRPAEASGAQDLKTTAVLVSGMYPEIEAGVISVPAALQALDSLSATAERYGEVLKQIVPVDRFVPLAREAAKLAKVDG